MKTICRQTKEVVHSGASSDVAVWCHCDSVNDCRLESPPATEREGRTPAKERETLQREIASILDHPSVFMGGPSRQNLQKADRILKHLSGSKILLTALDTNSVGVGPMSDTIGCWKPWLALADETPRSTRKDLGPHLFLGSRLGGDGREIFQGDGHGNQLVAVAINDDVAKRLVGRSASADPEKEVAHLIVEHLNEDMTNALEVARIIVRRLEK